MASPSAPPHPGAAPKSSPESDPFRIVVTGLDSNVEQFAREAAYNKLSKNPEGPIWSRVLKSAWNNMSHDYQYIKAKEEARHEIEESGNLLHHHNMSDEEWREAVVARQGSDFAEQLIREDAGEKLKRINAAEAVADPNAARMRDDAVSLLGRYARGEFTDDDSFEAEWERVQQGWRDDEISQDFIGEGKFLGTNILQGAKQLKGIMDGITGLDRVDAEMKVDEMLTNMELVTGESKVGSQVEIEDSLAERLASKMQNSKFLSEGRLSKITTVVGNETFVAATLAAATYGASRAASMVVTGMGGGLAAGLRERRALKVERALARRRRYMGEETTEMPDTSGLTGKEKAYHTFTKLTGIGESEEERRAEVDATLASAETYENVMGSLNGLYDDTGKLKISTAEELSEAMRVFATAQARSKGEDLISYQNIDNKDNMDAEFQLIVALSKIETDLKKLYEDGSLGTTADQFEDAYKGMLSAAGGVLKEEIEASDRLWSKLEKTRILRKTIVGGALGVAAGAGMHAVGSFFGGGSAAAATGHGSTNLSDGHSAGAGGASHSPDVNGGHGATHSPEGAGSTHSPEDLGGEGQSSTQELSDTSKITMPEGYKADVSGDTMTVTTPDGKTIGGLEINKDGSLTAAAQNTLRENGLKLSDHVSISHGEAVTSHANVSAKEFAENHRGQMTKIGHREWVNGENALKLQNHVNADGSITIDVSGMSDDAWKDAAVHNQASVYLSTSSGSSAHGFKVPIDANGKAHISADNPAMSLFGKDGQFHGGYEEAAVSHGTENGADNISVLATTVGDNKDTFTDMITSQEPVAHHEYTLGAARLGADSMYFSSPMGAAAEFAVPVITPTGLLGRTRIGRAEKVTPVATPTAPGASTSAAAGGSAATGPTPGGTGPTPGPGGGGPTSPESGKPSETYTDAERTVLAGIDATDLTMDPGFEFAGYKSYGEREQKMAMQFVDIAKVSLGDDAETTALAQEALKMAETYRSFSTPDMAAFYADVAAFLAEALAEAETREAAAAAAADESETATSEGETTSEAEEPTAEPKTEPETSEAPEAGEPTTEPEAEPEPVAEPEEEQKAEEPETSTTAAEEEAAKPEEAKAADEATFLADLDAEALEVPDGGYDFKGWRDIDLRQRKLAVRFIRQAIADVGERNKVEVVDRAADLASQAAAAAGSDEMRQLYTETVSVLGQSREKVAGSEKREIVDTLLDNITPSSDPAERWAEERREPFPFDLMDTNGRQYVQPSSDPRVNRLVARIFKQVSGGTLFKPSDVDPYYPGYEDRERPGDDAYRAAFNKKLDKLVRNALVILHPDKVEKLDEGLRGIADEARGIFADAQNSLRLKRERDYDEAAKRAGAADRARREAGRR